MATKNSVHATSSSLASERASKAPKPSKIVRLHLPSASLAQFAPKSSSRKDSKPNSSSSSTSTPVPPVPSASSNDNASDNNSTPGPGTAPSSQPEADDAKRKGIPGPKPGAKRSAASGPDSMPKPRAKPGPKKKARLENGGAENGNAIARPWTTAPTLATHKLGPKANQGAINAGLRALDRSGKPCRKWERKGFSVKSFTGVTWHLPSWRAPKTSPLKLNGEDKDADAAIEGQSKNNSSSAVDSEKSNSGADAAMINPANVNANSPVLDGANITTNSPILDGTNITANSPILDSVNITASSPILHGTMRSLPALEVRDRPLHVRRPRWPRYGP